MNKNLKNLECEAKDISCKGRCQTEINLNCDFGTFYIEEVKELILTRIKELEEKHKNITNFIEYIKKHKETPTKIKYNKNELEREIYYQLSLTCSIHGAITELKRLLGD